jgi:hypothetical protein
MGGAVGDDCGGCGAQLELSFFSSIHRRCWRWGASAADYSANSCQWWRLRFKAVLVGFVPGVCKHDTSSAGTNSREQWRGTSSSPAAGYSGRGKHADSGKR